MAAGFSCYLIILFYNGALLSGVIKKFDKMRSEIKEEKWDGVEGRMISRLP